MMTLSRLQTLFANLLPFIPTTPPNEWVPMRWTDRQRLRAIIVMVYATIADLLWEVGGTFNVNCNNSLAVQSDPCE